jgi:hypothetical protein
MRNCDVVILRPLPVRKAGYGLLVNDRLRAVCDVMMPVSREMAGLHEYDGRVQDLSPGGVRDALAAMAAASRSGPLPDRHDEAHLAVFEESLRVQYGVLELHRRDPYPHLSVNRRQPLLRGGCRAWLDPSAGGSGSYKVVR